MREAERVQVVVVGGGQAGLTVGYYLARRGLPFVILDASPRIGDSWRNRWDSLRLFSPARYDGLPGMPFPAGVRSWPTKDEMGDYLESYAARFALPVRSGVEVTRLSKRGSSFLVEAGDRSFMADQVVLAMSGYQRPRVPAFAKDLDPTIVQLHSSGYRNPVQLDAGSVLVVGAGNSGAEIAVELVRHQPTFVAGKEPGHVPFRIESVAGRFLLVHLIRFLGHHVLTVDTPMGRKMRRARLHGGTPLIRVKPKDMVALGIHRVPRVTGVRNGLPELEDGRVMEVRNVIWCTGFEPAHSWIELPIFDRAGDPLHNRGIVARQPGLYFVGLHFLYSMTSGLINGVARDAEWVVNALAARASAETPDSPRSKERKGELASTA
jgi:putative flavoprotein involved in K+ transport